MYAYAEAEAACAAVSAHLATPRSERQNRCAQLVAAGSPAWLGVNDRAVHTQWEPVDGCGPISIPTRWWLSGQPEDNEEHCAAMQAAQTWNDANCLRIEEIKRPLCQLHACYQNRCDGVYAP